MLRWEELLRGAITLAFQQGVPCPDKKQVLFFLLPFQSRRLIPLTLDEVNLCSKVREEESPMGHNSVWNLVSCLGKVNNEKQKPIIALN